MTDDGFSLERFCRACHVAHRVYDHRPGDLGFAFAFSIAARDTENK